MPRSEGLAVFRAVDEVSDVMKVSRDFCEFDKTVVKTQCAQDIARFFSHQRHVGKAVFGISERR